MGNNIFKKLDLPTTLFVNSMANKAVAHVGTSIILWRDKQHCGLISTKVSDGIIMEKRWCMIRRMPSTFNFMILRNKSLSSKDEIIKMYKKMTGDERSCEEIKVRLGVV